MSDSCKCSDNTFLWIIVVCHVFFGTCDGHPHETGKEEAVTDIAEAAEKIVRDIIKEEKLKVLGGEKEEKDGLQGDSKKKSDTEDFGWL